MKRFIILIPLYNDWKSVSKLLEKIDLQIINWDVETSIILVNDASTEERPNLDLNYIEDANAQVDANFVICESGKIVEIQVTGEEYSFSDEQFQSILTLAKKGISEIIQKQKEVLS